MKARTHERECARTETTKQERERECAHITNELESDPKALSLVVRIAESFASRSRVRRR